jgi:hypothetical protein
MLEANRNTGGIFDYELYAWEQFPDILFFDTADYTVQDAFFKRLAFFAEKKNYRGTLVSDSIMGDQHGFNAHDYRPETLAGFFSLVERTGFSVNEHEILLREILLANGIIVENPGYKPDFPSDRYKPGRGAVISISAESEDYLRRQFIVHEGLHGLYFTHAEFRAEVEKVFNETDPLSREFLVRYFDVTPSLAYDIGDSYLLHNEFMAYLLQQSVPAVSGYFSDRIANYVYINRFHPDLAKYVRDTRAQGLTQSAKKLSEYLSAQWDLEAGRVWKKSR